MRTARYSYANVPYRLAGYAALRRDPRATITFDAALHRAIGRRLPEVGADARLVTGPDGGVLHVNLTEKLLVLVLVRLTNFIPGGRAIWMNTQRPEWNDANNALVGYGVSMVTLCHLRRLLAHCRAVLLPTLGPAPVPVSAAVAELAAAVQAALTAHASALDRPDFDAASGRRALRGMIWLPRGSVSGRGSMPMAPGSRRTSIPRSAQPCSNARWHSPTTASAPISARTVWLMPTTNWPSTENPPGLW